MAGSYNRVILMGNLTRDPEVRTTPGGTQVANFGLAVNDRFHNKQTGQWEDRANFIDCAAFGKAAESIARFFTKGRPIMLEGKLRYSQWQAQDGSKRSKIEVAVDSWTFCDSNQGGGGGRQPQQQGGYNAPQQQPHQSSYDAPQYDAIPDDDIPF